MKDFFSVKKICYGAMFSALAYVLMFLEFPIFPQISDLKLDFSFAIMLLGAYILGFGWGEIIVVVVSLLNLITSHTFGVGQLANFVIGQCFIVLPSLIYHFKKGLKNVIITLSACIILMVAVALFFNRFVLFPLRMGSEVGKKVFTEFFWFILAFNLIKGVANAIICILLYKRLKRFLDGLFSDDKVQ